MFCRSLLFSSHKVFWFVSFFFFKFRNLSFSSLLRPSLLMNSDFPLFPSSPSLFLSLVMKAFRSAPIVLFDQGFLLFSRRHPYVWPTLAVFLLHGQVT